MRLSIQQLSDQRLQVSDDCDQHENNLKLHRFKKCARLILRSHFPTLLIGWATISKSVEQNSGNYGDMTAR